MLEELKVKWILRNCTLIEEEDKVDVTNGHLYPSL